MTKRPKHPKITPLRALELLRDLDESSKHYAELKNGQCAISRVRDALANHVRAHLGRRR